MGEYVFQNLKRLFSSREESMTLMEKDSRTGHAEKNSAGRSRTH
jgi:hypothetical protein